MLKVKKRMKNKSLYTRSMRGIYLEGRYHGIYYNGAVIQAKRDEGPEVKKGEFYTVAGIVESEIGSCAKNLAIQLEGTHGIYSKKTFRVNEECMKRMSNH